MALLTTVSTPAAASSWYIACDRPAVLLPFSSTTTPTPTPERAFSIRTALTSSAMWPGRKPNSMYRRGRSAEVLDDAGEELDALDKQTPTAWTKLGVNSAARSSQLARPSPTRRPSDSRALAAEDDRTGLCPAPSVPHDGDDGRHPDGRAGPLTIRPSFARSPSAPRVPRSSPAAPDRSAGLSPCRAFQAVRIKLRRLSPVGRRARRPTGTVHGLQITVQRGCGQRSAENRD